MAPIFSKEGLQVAKNQFDNDNNDVFADELFDDTDNFEKIQLGEDNLETAPLDDNLTDILDGFAAEADEDEDWLLNNAGKGESETLDLDTAVIPDTNFVGQPSQEVVTDETMVVDPLKMREVTENTEEPEFEDAYIATAPIEAPHQQTGLFTAEDLPDDQEDAYATGPIDTVSGDHDDHDDIYLDEDDGKKHRKIFWIFIGTLIAVCAIVIAVLGYNAYSKIREEEALKSTTTTTTDTTPTTSTTTVKPTERDESTSDYSYSTNSSDTSTSYNHTDEDDDDDDTDDYTDTTETTQPDTTQTETTTTTTQTTDHTTGDSSTGTNDNTTTNTDHTTNSGATTDSTAGTEP